MPVESSDSTKVRRLEAAVARPQDGRTACAGPASSACQASKS
jgi:hypothetical protein